MLGGVGLSSCGPAALSAEQMAARFILPILREYLGVFIKNLEADQFSVSLWSGTITLTDLELRENAFRGIDGLPVALDVVRSRINCVEVSVPYTRLDSDPVKINIDSLQVILVRSDSTSVGTASETAAARSSAAWALKRRQIDLHSASLELEEGAAEAEAEADGTSSYLERLTARIIDNLEINVSNLHVQLIDRVDVPKSVGFGVSCDRVSLFTTDARGNRNFVQRDGTHRFMHKRCEIKGIRAYWLPSLDTSNACTMELSDYLRTCALRHAKVPADAGALGMSHSLVPETDIDVSLVACDRKRHNDPTIPLTQLSVTLNEFRLELPAQALKDLIILLETASNRYFRRPAQRPTVAPRAWWSYACRRVRYLVVQSGPMRTQLLWRKIYNFARDSARYRRLYQQQCLASELDDSSLQEITRLERHVLTVEMIVLLRQQVKDQLNVQQGQDRTETQDDAVGFLGYLFGSTPAAVHVSEKTAASPGHRHRRHQQQSNRTSYSSRPVLTSLVFQFHFINGGLTLLDARCRAFMVCHISGRTSISVMTDQSWSQTVSLDSIAIDFASTTNETTTQTVVVQNLMTESSGKEQELAGGVFSLELAEQFTDGSLSRRGIQAKLVPMVINVDWEFVAEVTKFGRHAISESLRLSFGSIAERQLEQLGEWSTDRMLHLFEASYELDVSIDMASPSLVLTGYSDMDQQVLAIDLGRLHVSSSSDMSVLPNALQSRGGIAFAAKSRHRVWTCAFEQMQVLVHEDKSLIMHTLATGTSNADATVFRSSDLKLQIVPCRDISRRVNFCSACLREVEIHLSPKSLVMMQSIVDVGLRSMAHAQPSSAQATPAPRTSCLIVSSELHSVKCRFSHMWKGQLVPLVDVLVDDMRAEYSDTCNEHQASVVVGAFRMEDLVHSGGDFGTLVESAGTEELVVANLTVPFNLPPEELQATCHVRLSHLIIGFNPTTIAMLVHAIRSITDEGAASGESKRASPDAIAGGETKQGLDVNNTGLSTQSRMSSVQVALDFQLEELKVRLNKPYLERQLAEVLVCKASIRMQLRESFNVSHSTGRIGNLRIFDLRTSDTRFREMVGLLPSECDSLLKFSLQTAKDGRPPVLEARMEAFRVVSLKNFWLEMHDYVSQGIVLAVLGAASSIMPVAVPMPTSDTLAETPDRLIVRLHLAGPRVILPVCSSVERGLQLAAESIIVHTRYQPLVSTHLEKYTSDALPSELAHCLEVQLVGAGATTLDGLVLTHQPLEMTSNIVLHDRALENLGAARLECLIDSDWSDCELALREDDYIMMQQILRDNIGMQQEVLPPVATGEMSDIMVEFNYGGAADVPFRLLYNMQCSGLKLHMCVAEVQDAEDEGLGNYTASLTNLAFEYQSYRDESVRMDATVQNMLLQDPCRRRLFTSTVAGEQVESGAPSAAGFFQVEWQTKPSGDQIIYMHASKSSVYPTPVSIAQLERFLLADVPSTLQPAGHLPINGAEDQGHRLEIRATISDFGLHLGLGLDKHIVAELCGIITCIVPDTSISECYTCDIILDDAWCYVQSVEAGQDCRGLLSPTRAALKFESKNIVSRALTVKLHETFTACVSVLDIVTLSSIASDWHDSSKEAQQEVDVHQGEQFELEVALQRATITLLDDTDGRDEPLMRAGVRTFNLTANGNVAQRNLWCRCEMTLVADYFDADRQTWSKVVVDPEWRMVIDVLIEPLADGLQHTIVKVDAEEDLRVRVPSSLLRHLTDAARRLQSLSGQSFDDTMKCQPFLICNCTAFPCKILASDGLLLSTLSPGEDMYHDSLGRDPDGRRWLSRHRPRVGVRCLLLQSEVSASLQLTSPSVINFDMKSAGSGAGIAAPNTPSIHFITERTHGFFKTILHTGTLLKNCCRSHSLLLRIGGIVPGTNVACSHAGQVYLPWYAPNTPLFLHMQEAIVHVDARAGFPLHMRLSPAEGSNLGACVTELRDDQKGPRYKDAGVGIGARLVSISGDNVSGSPYSEIMEKLKSLVTRRSGDPYALGFQLPDSELQWSAPFLASACGVHTVAIGDARERKCLTLRIYECNDTRIIEVHPQMTVRNMLPCDLRTHIAPPRQVARASQSYVASGHQIELFHLRNTERAALSCYTTHFGCRADAAVEIPPRSVLFTAREEAVTTTPLSIVMKRPVRGHEFKLPLLVQVSPSASHVHIDVRASHIFVNHTGLPLTYRRNQSIDRLLLLPVGLPSNDPSPRAVHLEPDAQLWVGVENQGSSWVGPLCKLAPGHMTRLNVICNGVARQVICRVEAGPVSCSMQSCYFVTFTSQSMIRITESPCPVFARISDDPLRQLLVVKPDQDPLPLLWPSSLDHHRLEFALDPSPGVWSQPIDVKASGLHDIDVEMPGGEILTLRVTTDYIGAYQLMTTVKVLWREGHEAQKDVDDAEGEEGDAEEEMVLCVGESKSVSATPASASIPSSQLIASAKVATPSPTSPSARSNPNATSRLDFSCDLKGISVELVQSDPSSRLDIHKNKPLCIIRLRQVQTRAHVAGPMFSAELSVVKADMTDLTLAEPQGCVEISSFDVTERRPKVAVDAQVVRQESPGFAHMFKHIMLSVGDIKIDTNERFLRRAQLWMLQCLERDTVAGKNAGATDQAPIHDSMRGVFSHLRRPWMAHLADMPSRGADNQRIFVARFLSRPATFEVTFSRVKEPILDEQLRQNGGVTLSEMLGSDASISLEHTRIELDNVRMEGVSGETAAVQSRLVDKLAESFNRAIFGRDGGIGLILDNPMLLVHLAEQKVGSMAGHVRRGVGSFFRKIDVLGVGKASASVSSRDIEAFQRDVSRHIPENFLSRVHSLPSAAHVWAKYRTILASGDICDARAFYYAMRALAFDYFMNAVDWSIGLPRIVIVGLVNRSSRCDVRIQRVHIAGTPGEYQILPFGMTSVLPHTDPGGAWNFLSTRVVVLTHSAGWESRVQIVVDTNVSRLIITDDAIPQSTHPGVACSALRLCNTKYSSEILCLLTDKVEALAANISD